MERVPWVITRRHILPPWRQNKPPRWYGTPTRKPFSAKQVCVAPLSGTNDERSSVRRFLGCAGITVTFRVRAPISNAFYLGRVAFSLRLLLYRRQACQRYQQQVSVFAAPGCMNSL